MNWKNLKLGKKFFIAFGTIILLLVVLMVVSFSGTGKIVENAGQVIEGNALRTDLEQKYVQHLQWAQDVSTLLTDDNVTKLTVQTDYHKCAFGEWFYGEGRKHAEELAPELKPLFAQMEEPHKALHESAINITAVFKQGDQQLSNSLRDAKVAHLQWDATVKNTLLSNKKISAIDVIKDPTQCGFGKWLYSEKVKQLASEDPEFGAMISKVEQPHRNLHESVINIENFLKEGKKEQALQYYNTNTEPIIENLLKIIDAMVAWNDSKVEGMEKANAIYNTDTRTALAKMGDLFKEVIDQSKNYIMTDQAMLGSASKTRLTVITFGLIAALLAILFAVIIARGIINPIKKGVIFAKQVAEGDLLAEVDVEQQDEIGMLAKALKQMVEKLRIIVEDVMGGADSILSAGMQMSSTSQELSQGASEQASSAEEVSSSMEEMVSNIEQNAENARQTEKISMSSSEGMKRVQQASEESLTSIKNIAEKIAIVNDIAFQTNILALNAAVEAARAGEHGKGFAVVAAEVRKLAERSKIAAGEIELMSKTSVNATTESAELINKMLPEIDKTARLVQEITAASLEQNSGADQINNALQQLNQIIQQNAAASEEMATSSEELSAQAEQLKQTVSFFKTDHFSKSITKPQVKKNPKQDDDKSMYTQYFEKVHD